MSVAFLVVGFWWSSESDEVVSATFAALFFAVAGPFNGLLFLRLGPSSSSSWAKEVGKSAADGLFGLRLRLSGMGLGYNCVGSSSSDSLGGVKGRRLTGCCARLRDGMSGDEAVAKCGIGDGRLLGVPEEPDGPGVSLSWSSLVSMRCRLGCSVCLLALSAPVVFNDLSQRLSVLRWTVLRFCRIASIRYWFTFCLVGFVCNASVAAFFTDSSAKASGLCKRQLKAMTWIAIIITGPQALKASINNCSVFSSLWTASMTSRMSSLSGGSWQ